MNNPLECLVYTRASDPKPGQMPSSEHTVNDQCRVRSSRLIEADGTPVAIAARLAVLLVDCHIVLEVLEPVEGLWSQDSGRVVPVERADKEL